MYNIRFSLVKVFVYFNPMLWQIKNIYYYYNIKGHIEEQPYIVVINITYPCKQKNII